MLASPSCIFPPWISLSILLESQPKHIVISRDGRPLRRWCYHFWHVVGIVSARDKCCAHFDGHIMMHLLPSTIARLLLIISRVAHLKLLLKVESCVRFCVWACRLKRWTWSGPSHSRRLDDYWTMFGDLEGVDVCVDDVGVTAAFPVCRRGCAALFADACRERRSDVLCSRSQPGLSSW
jgi:hypothetical protein